MDNYRQAQRNLIQFFGANKPLSEINAGDADELKAKMLEIGLAENTVPAIAAEPASSSVMP